MMRHAHAIAVVLGTTAGILSTMITPLDLSEGVALGITGALLIAAVIPE